MPLIRPVLPDDDDALWAMLEPMLRAGETYALPREWSRGEALAFWLGGDHEAFVALAEGRVVGTYYLRANQLGGGAGVANAGYLVQPRAGGNGIATAMAEHSLGRARERGFRAMQFNFVVSTNERAVSLWERLGFAIVGRLPRAFDHPARGAVDALVMHRSL